MKSWIKSYKVPRTEFIEKLSRACCSLHSLKVQAFLVSFTLPWNIFLNAYKITNSISGMALAFWYGGHLLADREINGYELFVIFLAIVSGGEAAGSFFAQSNSKIFNPCHTSTLLNTKFRYCPGTFSCESYSEYENDSNIPYIGHGSYPSS